MAKDSININRTAYLLRGIMPITSRRVLTPSLTELDNKLRPKNPLNESTNFLTKCVAKRSLEKFHHLRVKVAGDGLQESFQRVVFAYGTHCPVQDVEVNLR